MVVKLHLIVNGGTYSYLGNLVNIEIFYKTSRGVEGMKITRIATTSRRTARLGGHKETCENCEYLSHTIHSETGMTSDNA